MHSAHIYANLDYLTQRSSIKTYSSALACSPREMESNVTARDSASVDDASVGIATEVDVDSLVISCSGTTVLVAGP